MTTSSVFTPWLFYKTDYLRAVFVITPIYKHTVLAGNNLQPALVPEPVQAVWDPIQAASEQVLLQAYGNDIACIMSAGVILDAKNIKHICYGVLNI